MIYNDYFNQYISLVKSDHYLDALETQLDENPKLFSDISDIQGNTAYAEGKWTIKELIMHIVDCERVFAHRALTIAREDHPTLPGFNEDMYAFRKSHNTKNMSQIIDEYRASKQNTITLFKGFDKDELNRVGNANGHDLQVEAIGWIVPGHDSHHINILKERYLSLHES